jgi:hypothetical protein
MNEYEAYYELRFDKKPKVVRKLKDGEESSIRIAPQAPSSKKSSSVSKPPAAAATQATSGKTQKQPSVIISEKFYFCYLIPINLIIGI